MWQRFKEAVDARIQEEQARQRLQPQPSQASSATSSPRVRPRASSRNISPSRRQRRRDVENGSDNDRNAVPAKGPDPSEFEPEFVIGEASEASTRVATPIPGAKGLQGPSPLGKEKQENGDGSEKKEKEKEKEDGQGDTTEDSSVTEKMQTELPTEIQQRLKKLDRLEPKYSELLRSYRVAHARISAIEPFEATLREHTPLTSINDPGALVEFLQQGSLKSSLLMDELKKAVEGKDEMKKKLDEAEKKTKELEQEVEKLRSVQQPASNDNQPSTKKPPKDDDGEDFFSYEDEIKNEVKDLEAKNTKLQEENTALKIDLASAQDSAKKLAHDLELSAKDLESVREARDSLQATAQTQNKEHDITITNLRKEVESAEKNLKAQRSVAEKHAKALKQVEDGLSKTQSGESHQTKEFEQKIRVLEKDIVDARELAAQQGKRNETLNSLVQTLRSQLQQVQTPSNPELKTNGTNLETAKPSEGVNSEAVASGPKKKNKKKKKGGKTAESNEVAPKSTETEDATPVEAPKSQDATSPTQLELVQEELKTLLALCEDKDASIARLDSKLRDQEGLLEEIETLRDEVIHVGQEHVEAKDRIKELQAERSALKESITRLEEEVAGLKTNHELHSSTAEAHQSLSADFKQLKAKADALEVDLAAAQKLAVSRFKELTDLREVLQRAQPELQSLRSEVSDLRKSKEEFLSKSTEVRRLEGREKDLKNEIARFKKQLSDRDTDVRSLNEKLSSANSSRRDMEESLRKAQRELKTAQGERKEAVDARDKSSKELSKAQDEIGTARNSLSKLESQLAKLTTDASALRDELSLKTAQYASAQSLMTSMQDQTQELSAQMKETRERCESLEEELADAHRLLSERSREAETMRRLLSEVDGRADQRVKEMQAQLDIAMEERDRAEEQVSNVGRKRAREVEELRSKVRAAEAAVKKAESDKEVIEMQQKELRRQKEAIEARSSKADDEANEIREAMRQLRDALDESERLAREAEKEKAELRQWLEEATERVEKLQKNNKSMSEELKSLQPQHGGMGSVSRSSLESTNSPHRLASPPPRNAASPAGQSAVQGKVDYVYLKNVLLQFLEQKDKKHQMALVPVLGMLLHFDKKDEQKWMSAIRAV